MQLSASWRAIHRWFVPPPVSIRARIEAVWTVDMHNHLLPGVDDGITTLDDTLTCLRQYVDWGIRQVVCTPHVSQDYYPNNSSHLADRLAFVQQAVDEAGLPIRLTLAAEYLLDEAFDRLLQRDELLCFGAARYVLIETGWAAPPQQLDHWLFTMQLKGYTPVLAHPERYRYYQNEPYLLKQLRAQGCLLQLNLMSLVGRYGSRTKRFAHELLQEQCISFVSSDLHRPSDLAALHDVFTSSSYQYLQNQPLSLHNP